MCKTQGCNNEAAARGLCLPCYNHLHKAGKIPGQKICKIEGCKLGPLRDSICRKHLRTRQAEKPENECVVEGCKIEYTVMLMCKKHYEREYRKTRKKFKGPPPARTLKNQGPCIVEGCGNKALSRERCRRHYLMHTRTAEICQRPRCNKLVFHFRQCKAHYKQYRKNRDA